jgi:hypothetical protein
MLFVIKCEKWYSVNTFLHISFLRLIPEGVKVSQIILSYADILPVYPAMSIIADMITI